jgi:hypothetical protein
MRFRSPRRLTKLLHGNHAWITRPVNTPGRALPRLQRRMAKLAPSLLLTIVLALGALAAPGTAHAANPCWKELVNDYWADNRVDKIYDISCYREAMEKLPRDVQEYSDAQDDLRRALLLAIRDNRSNGGFGDSNDEDRTAAAPVEDEGGGGGFFREVLDKLGPKNADSVPVPLLVLASIAILLLGAAGASYGVRWYQVRRGTFTPSPSPSPAPQPREPRP